MSATGSGFGCGFCAVTGAGGGAGCCTLAGAGFGTEAAGFRAGAWVCAGGKNVAGRLAVWQAVLAKRSEEHTSELQSRFDLVCRLLLEKKKKKKKKYDNGR